MGNVIHYLSIRAIKDGKVYHLSHSIVDQELWCFETNRRAKMTRRECRELCKKNGWQILPNLKLGEYVNVNTGKIEKLYGI